jgi:hypothetical protein
MKWGFNAHLMLDKSRNVRLKDGAWKSVKEQPMTIILKWADYVVIV